jgi:hypothetical protein
MSGGLSAWPTRLFHQEHFDAARPIAAASGSRLTQPQESQNRENHNDHADEPENVIHGRPNATALRSVASRASEAAHMPRKAAALLFLAPPADHTPARTPLPLVRLC